MRVGDSTPRHDAYTKVTGAERYAADYYSDDFVWAGVKRAGIPHGLIRAIDCSEARAVPGVVAVLTHKDVAGTNRQGIVLQDQPILAEDRIRYAGEPLALVIARSRRILKDALDSIHVDAQALPGVFTTDDALRPDAPLIHEGHPTGNIVREVKVVKGEGESAFEACDVVAEISFRTPRQEHACLETEAGWAFIDEDGTIVIIASTQTPFRDRLELAHALGCEPERFRTVAPYLGGAFGGKDGLTVQAYLALAAQHAGGKPVKMWWDREERFTAGVKRMAATIDYRLGAKADGTMLALACRLVYDSGAYANLTGEIMTLGAEHAGGAYAIPHTSIHGYAVYTNNALGGPFRGFGVPQVTAALEQVVDVLAARLNMDPLELRSRNALRQGDRNGIGVTMTASTRVKECLDAIRASDAWRSRETWKREAGTFKRRGVGAACLAHAMGYPKIVPDRASAKIELTAEGKIRIGAGVADMGQGNASTYVQLAGHMLGQERSRMELVLPDTAYTLPCGSASASRCTYVFGNALVDACAQMKELIVRKASGLLGAPGDALRLESGRVAHSATGQSVSLGQVALSCAESERTVTATYTAPVPDENTGVIYLGPHLLYSYAAHCARIEIDELTGEIDVKEYYASTDGGSVLNPQVYEQQIQGGIAQGIGYALTENLIIRDGIVITPNLATYTIPTAADIPDMMSYAIDIPEETGPFGMKGIAEIGINGPLPAIANAVADALGVRLPDGPFTAEKVLAAMQEARGGSEGP
jgi:CO/xanthine dehydrogenase Mo-binding subunit